MSAWWLLLQKEYRMTRTSALLSLAILIIGGLWLVYLSSRFNISVIIVPASFILVFLLFYPAIYMLKSLSWEWKVTPHLWLHCPQPAWMLLSAKLALALLQMLAIMLIAAAMLLLGISISPIPEELSSIALSSLFSFIIEVGFYAAIFSFAVSIYIGAWATLISVVNALAGNILGKFRWLAGVVAFIVAVAGFDQLQHTWIFELLTRWGPVNIRLQSLPELYREFGSHISVNTGAHMPMGQFYAGEALFYLLLTVALYALSCWLIDHKVEV
jgi:hypothetical protein